MRRLPLTQWGLSIPPLKNDLQLMTEYFRQLTCILSSILLSLSLHLSLRINICKCQKFCESVYIKRNQSVISLTMTFCFSRFNNNSRIRIRVYVKLSLPLRFFYKKSLGFLEILHNTTMRIALHTRWTNTSNCLIRLRLLLVRVSI